MKIYIDLLIFLSFKLSKSDVLINIIKMKLKDYLIEDQKNIYNNEDLVSEIFILYNLMTNFYFQEG